MVKYGLHLQSVASLFLVGWKFDDSFPERVITVLWKSSSCFLGRKWGRGQEWFHEEGMAWAKPGWMTWHCILQWQLLWCGLSGGTMARTVKKDGAGEFMLGLDGKAYVCHTRAHQWGAPITGFQARRCHDHIIEHSFLIVFAFHLSIQKEIIITKKSN